MTLRKRKRETRDWNSKQYKSFRAKVRKRDNHHCQWPRCRRTKKLKVHHILPWAKFPELRYEVSNGITLCRWCHDKIHGKELAYATFLTNIIKNQDDAKTVRKNEKRKRKELESGESDVPERNQKWHKYFSSLRKARDGRKRKKK